MNKSLYSTMVGPDNNKSNTYGIRALMANAIFVMKTAVKSRGRSQW